MASAGYGYGAPPAPPTGYHSPSHYSSYPSDYPHPPPYYAGHPGDPHAAATYAPQSGYPTYPYYPTQYSHHPNDHYAHYPYPPGPLYGAQSHYDNPPPYDTGPVKSKEVLFLLPHSVQPPANEHYAHYPYPPGPLYGAQSHYDNPPPNGTGPVKSKEVHLVPNPQPQGAVQEERVLIEDEAKEDSPEPLSIFTESENTTTESSASDVGKEGQKGCGNELHYVDQSMPPLAHPRKIYPPYSYYPTHYSHQPPEHYAHYPYPPGPLYGAQSHYDNPPPYDTGPVKSKEVHLVPNPQGAVQEERDPIEDKAKAKEDFPEPLRIFAESENTTTESSENDVCKEGQKGCGNGLYYVDQSMPPLAYPRKISECGGENETIRTD
eukprot:CAMPEP_0201902574 /NCGR_PEP_ID=MMETSP0902-20130614/55023_1 /ASSEMBLY_ACC=CAM_ASM_000551 /TAXON_ID=420261 /ORGANISM="Thalassiosira antarctica, Strain CCMP982" /LENGTH=376 /DNA_ID=CAMNT_0048436581 /DNA_START=473 /DNA_END=1604 /DNA_ORIENTATION=+